MVACLDKEVDGEGKGGKAREGSPEKFVGGHCEDDAHYVYILKLFKILANVQITFKSFMSVDMRVHRANPS